MSPDISTRYPESDPGFPAVPVGELLAQNGDLINRLRTCYGADGQTFESELLPLVHRYAGFVHLLPATADNYFGIPGGLLRLGLEVGFFSLQGTDAHILSGRSTISARRHLEPRWRLATFIAGMCCECHRVLSHMQVTDSSGEAWSGYVSPLSAWLEGVGASRYFIRWQPGAIETRSLGVFALPRIVSTDLMRYLSQDNSVVVPQLMASISGIALRRDHNVLDELVRRSLALVVDRNLTASADRYGKPQFGSHLERYLVDAIRRLGSSDSSWIPNREKSRVWYATDGLFLVWPAAAEDIRRLLEADQLRGIPKAPDTMLELLLAAGVLMPARKGHPIWEINPPGAKSPLEAVRLAAPAILFSGLGPAPTCLESRLCADPEGVPGDVPATPPGQEIAAQGPAPVQLTLLPEESKEAAMALEPDRPEPGPSMHSAGASTLITLRAPLRLNPAVREALAAIVGTLNGDSGPTQCCTVAEGLFVPLDQFEQRGVPGAVALRSLREVGLLVPPRHQGEGAGTRSRDFQGTPTVGLVVDPGAIDGFDLCGFVATSSQDS